MRFETTDNELLLYVDAAVYTQDVLHKCFYWYGNTYSIDIDHDSENTYKVSLRPLAGGNLPEELEVICDRIKRDLIDFKLRDIVTKETRVIRELLVAKAFAYYGLEDNPTSEVSDPVGSDPKDISM